MSKLSKKGKASKVRKAGETSGWGKAGKVSKAEAVRSLLLTRPDTPAAEIAKLAKVKPNYVYQVRWHMKKNGERTGVAKRGRPAKSKNLAFHRLNRDGSKSPVFLNLSPQAAAKANPADLDSTNPTYYQMGGIEVIDYIEAKKLNFNLGNVLKYMTRAEYKGSTLRDLQKAQWYLNREIGRHTSSEA